MCLSEKDNVSGGMSRHLGRVLNYTVVFHCCLDCPSLNTLLHPDGGWHVFWIMGNSSFIHPHIFGLRRGGYTFCTPPYQETRGKIQVLNRAGLSTDNPKPYLVVTAVGIVDMAKGWSTKVRTKFPTAAPPHAANARKCTCWIVWRWRWIMRRCHTSRYTIPTYYPACRRDPMRSFVSGRLGLRCPIICCQPACWRKIAVCIAVTAQIIPCVELSFRTCSAGVLPLRLCWQTIVVISSLFIHVLHWHWLTHVTCYFICRFITMSECHLIQFRLLA